MTTHYQHVYKVLNNYLTDSCWETECNDNYITVCNKRKISPDWAPSKQLNRLDWLYNNASIVFHRYEDDIDTLFPDLTKQEIKKRFEWVGDPTNEYFEGDIDLDVDKKIIYLFDKLYTFTEEMLNDLDSYT